MRAFEEIGQSYWWIEPFATQCALEVLHVEQFHNDFILL